MVMEMPSAQCVGQEFVRQYYTLLHEAPDYMHRFYSHDSSFVHGGIEKPGEELPPVMGQAAIHKKIMSLNFRDCHAKIRQVDSQSTIDKAVVVQVAGELSNAGQPMRRFMQTFVLAPQSPKKYYVHNDIFRYQDEVFHDIIDSEPEAAETENGNCYEPATQSFETFEQQEVSPVSNGKSHAETMDPSEPSVDSVPDSGISTVEADFKESVEEMQPTKQDADDLVALVVVPSAAPEEKCQQPESEPLSPEIGESVEPSVSSASPLSGNSSTALSEVKPPEPPKQVSWAALASKNMACTVTPVSAAPPKPQATVKPEIKPDMFIPSGPLPQRPQRIDRMSMERDGGGTGSVSGDGEETPRRVRYADNLQVFIGNLPHFVTEQDLREYFEKFGTVLDVRVNRRGPSKDIPSYAFIVFDNPDTAHKVLDSRPLFILDGKLRLNIEEKKQQSDYRSMGGARGSPRGGGAYRGYQPGRGNTARGGWRGRGRGSRGYGQGRSSDDDTSADDHAFEQSVGH